MNERVIKDLLKDQIVKSPYDFFRLSKAKLKKGTKVYEEIILLEARLNKIEEDNRKGIMQNDNYNQAINRVRADILSLINLLKREDIIASFVDKESLNKLQKDKKDFESKLRRFGLKRNLASEEGQKIYGDFYDQFIFEFEVILKEYCEVANLSFDSKVLNNKARIYKVDKATVNVIPCINFTKRFLWIGIEVDKKGEKKHPKNLGVFELDYTDGLELIWRNKENIDLIFTNKELGEIVNREVFEAII